MVTTDTIAAVSSPPGRSPRALIRVCGPLAGDLAREAGVPPGERAIWRGVFGLGAFELPVLAAFFGGERSFVGQDTLEMQTPGSPALVERVLAAILARGARLAEPGEFSARAYLAGRLSLAQAEGVAATIAAQTDAQLAAARSLRSGEAGREYQLFADECATLLALVEAGIDFTDQEDVVPISGAELRRRLASLRARIDAHLGSHLGSESHSGVPSVAIIGSPNAGKSTLFNALLGRRRAVESPIAGTTRDVLAEDLDLSRDVPGGGVVRLEDLPGLDARLDSPLDREAQAAARHAAEHADLLLWCDPAGRFEASGEEWKRLCGQRPTLRVRTFADRPVPGAQLSGELVAVCALDGWNLGVLRRAIADASTRSGAAPLVALLPRHRRAMAEAQSQIQAALALAAGPGRRPEELAGALRAALDALGELVGRISPDDVLGRVFATFCVGK